MRKTRKEKIIAQLRRKLSETEDIHSQPTTKVKFDTYSIPKNTTMTSVSVYQHTYFYHDLLKTLVVTGTILAIELVLYFFINTKSL